MISRSFCGMLVMLTAWFAAADQNNFTEAEAGAIKTFLHDNFRTMNACIVIGLADGNGNSTFSAGTMDNGTTGEVNGDTVFFIGSVSKTFTALLLQDMVERGEVKLDDPVRMYLPKSVRMPTHGGKEITLLDLATHAAGFPMNPGNMTGPNAKAQYENYTVEKMYAYLSGYTLSRDPGTEFEYSNVGMALLGHALARKAGTNFESLVVNRICRPLQMDNTCVTLTPELKTRLAMGHDVFGQREPPWKFQAYSPAGDIHSTANDLLKYTATEAGITQSSLSSATAKTHGIRYQDSRGMPGTPTSFFGRTAMDWADRNAFQPAGMELLAHAGGAGSFHAFVGFDEKQRRGVVVLSTANDLSVEAIGWTVLQRLPLTKDSLTEFAREIVGLGFAFDIDKATHTLRVLKVYPKSPASHAGLLAGLIIQKIEDVPTAGKTVPECQVLLRANDRPKVRLELIDPERRFTNTVEVSRGKFVTAG
ncbi:MAG TPA: serine hydrolase [Verrucomicrobiae bacterium]|jgi:D-alanyl-D-alanine-carboxypeptidase/D-alanyl-D-alanine-endopeptidase|nr:serine hydrolase [Verrucomicrobiae bacterium]